jgi:hypothetical protein
VVRAAHRSIGPADLLVRAREIQQFVQTQNGSGFRYTSRGYRILMDVCGWS